MIIRYRFEAASPKLRPSPNPAAPFSMDDFLFSVVGIQHNGTALTVNSMLARQNCDPWIEARHLLSCPTGEALSRLEEHIKSAPIEAISSEEALKMASNLLRLLYSSKGKSASFSVGRGPKSRAKPATQSVGPQASQKSGGSKMRKPMSRGDWIRIAVVVAGAAVLFTIELIDPRALISDQSNLTPNEPNQSQTTTPFNTR